MTDPTLAERLADPDMPADQMRLHFGEMTAQEMRTARAAIRFANARAMDALAQEVEAIVGAMVGEERAKCLPEELTPAQINDACLSYRHDFGLLPPLDQEQTRRIAGWWWTALQRAAIRAREGGKP